MEENQVSTEQIEQKNKEVSGSQNPDLNINDLVALKSIIDVASQRGAFKANELEAVGKVYNKLNNFLESVSKKES